MDVDNLRRFLPYTWLLVVIALGYAGWTVWSRNQDATRVAQEAREQEARRAAEVVRLTGGEKLKILSFYGTGRLICYGVANAKTVRIVPYVEDLKPSLSRCLEVHPGKPTEYKLTAEDGAGHTVEQSIVIPAGK